MHPPIPLWIRHCWRTRTDDDKLAWAAELRTLHSLYRRKTDNFWRTETSNGNTKKLRRTLQGILGETCSDGTSAHTADDFAGFFFQDKVDAVRTSASATPLYDVPFKLTTSSLDSWTAVTIDEVNKLISASPNKTCQLDPVPTWLVKQMRELLAPFITLLFNRSLVTDASRPNLNMPLFVRC